MRKISSLAAIVLVGIGIIGVTLLFLHFTADSATAKPSHSRVTNKTYSSNPGAPAITPHLQLTSNVAGHTTTGAAFTEDDVRNYVTTHPLPARFSFPSASKPVVVKIEFLPSSEVDTLVGETTGMPSSHLLCYVEFRGSASVSGPPRSSRTLQKIYEVFDAQTGNLLIIGGQ